MIAKYVPTSDLIIGSDADGKRLLFDENYLSIPIDYDECSGSIGSMSEPFLKAKTVGRYAQVLWSKPLLERRWHIPHQMQYTRIHALLSLALLKAHGQEVVLYTDDQGAQLLGDLPYHRIYNILDVNPTKASFWASGKIIALDNEPLDSCVIDTDLFVFDGDILDRINRGGVLCSHLEYVEKYQDIVTDFTTKNFLPLNKTSVNTGLLKIDDPVKKQAYINSYFAATRAVKKGMLRFFDREELKLFWVEIFKQELRQDMSEEEKQKLANDIQARYPERNGLYCADLICEQYMFSLLEPIPIFDERVACGVLKHLGFCHLISMDKFLRIKDVIDRLREFPENKLLHLEFEVTQSHELLSHAELM